MLKKLRRWHFDVALFLGLAIFATAYWYSKSRPLWTKFHPTTANAVKPGFKFLGFAQDSQSFYTCSENWKVNNVWPVPQIQQWSTQTGEMLNERLFEIPPDDQFLYELPRVQFETSFDVMYSPTTSHFAVRYFQSKTKDHHYTRFYDQEGKPVWKGIETPSECRVSYLKHQSSPQQQVLASYHYQKNDKLVTISLLDLNTGTTLSELPPIEMNRLSGFIDMPGGPPLLFLQKEGADKNKIIEVINLKTREAQNSVGVPDATFHHFDHVIANQLVLGNLTTGPQQSMMKSLHFYHYDPLTKSLQPDHVHPLDGLANEYSQDFMVSTPFLYCITNKSIQLFDSPFFKTIFDWLGRFGIRRSDENTCQIRVLDLITGKPLRQVSAIPRGNNSICPDSHYVLAMFLGPANELGFSAYAIPHYLVESTLSWAQWLSWLLILPWPMRYFFPARPQHAVPKKAA